MDLSKLLSEGTKAIELYLAVLIKTVLKPKALIFTLPAKTPTINLNPGPYSSSINEYKINKTYIGYFLVSIFLGFHIYINIPTTTPGYYADEITAFVIVLFLWLIYSGLYILIHRLFFKSNNRKIIFIKVLHVLATLYLLCNLLTLIAVILITNITYVGPHERSFLPIKIYNFTHFILLLIYVPLATVNLKPYKTPKLIAYWILLIILTVIISFISMSLSLILHIPAFG